MRLSKCREDHFLQFEYKYKQNYYQFYIWVFVPIVFQNAILTNQRVDSEGQMFIPSTVTIFMMMWQCMQLRGKSMKIQQLALE